MTDAEKIEAEELDDKCRFVRLRLAKALIERDSDETIRRLWRKLDVMSNGERASDVSREAEEEWCK